MLIFPPSPKDAEEYTQDGITYTYNLKENTWYISGNGNDVNGECLWGATKVIAMPIPPTKDPFWANGVN